MLTGQGTIETAEEAMRRGAFAYLSKPFLLDELESIVQRAREANQLQMEKQPVRAVRKQGQGAHEMIGYAKHQR